MDYLKKHVRTGMGQQNLMKAVCVLRLKKKSGLKNKIVDDVGCKFGRFWWMRLICPSFLKFYFRVFCHLDKTGICLNWNALF